ncbi:peptidase MA family metallohydrolase [Chloroflexota bacterium]
MVIKKASIFILVVCLFLVLLGPAPVQAQDGLTILDSSVETEFPSQLHFNLSVKSDVNVTDVRLHYTVDRASYAQVTSEVYIEFVPDTTVDIQWAWDMRKTGGLPPGTGLEYWWTVEDAGVGKLKTIPTRVRFDDNRYSWESLTEGKLTIYWYEGAESFAEELMLAAQQALARLAEDTGAYLKKPVKIFIYANSQDLQGAMIFTQEWTGGVSFFTYSIIAIGIAPHKLEWGKRAITHELTHQCIYQVTTNPYSGLPRWLHEGLAMYNEGSLEPWHVNLLGKAIAEDSLISVRSLSSPFSAYGEEAYLSYAQSYSLVEFLITSYGQGKMLELFTTFSEGSSYDGALEKVYGFDMDNLDTLWQDYVVKQYQEAGVKQEIGGGSIVIHGK